MNKLEEAIKEFNKLIQLRISKTDRKIKYDNCIVSTEKLQTVLQALENSIPKQTIEEKKEIAQEEYQYILNNMERKISHTKDEHKIRATYAEFGVKRGRAEILEELMKGE